MKIEICEHCKGYGKLKWDVGTHHSEYEYEVCPMCKGSGRVEVTETTIKEPFNPDENKSCRKF